jgi:V8-like Glu-specific endopeptidase
MSLATAAQNGDQAAPAVIQSWRLGSVPINPVVDDTAPILNLVASKTAGQINGADDRFFQQGSISFPARTNVKIFSTWQGSQGTTIGGCSGTLVGSRMVLTAAHCVDESSIQAAVLSTSSFANSIKVIPALELNYMPFGDANGTVIKVGTNWDPTSPNNNVGDDFAVIELDRNIGSITGIMGTVNLGGNAFGRKFIMNGYPADLPEAGSLRSGLLMYEADGAVLYDCRGAVDMFGHDADTAGGQSGAGLTFNFMGAQNWVGAIHHGTNSGTNTACAISSTNGPLIALALQDNSLPVRSAGDAAPWVSLNGFTDHPITATRGGYGKAEAFVRGTNGQVFTREWSGGTFSPPTSWLNIGGIVTKELAAASTPSGEIHVFGRGSDGRIWTKVRLAADSQFVAGDAGWFVLSNSPVLGDAAPTAISVGNNFFVFAVGTNGNVWTVNFDGVSWGSWQNIGGAAVESVSAVSIHSGSRNTNNLDPWVFYRDQFGQIYSKFQLSGAWSPFWSQLPGAGTLRAAPSAVSMVDGRFDLFGPGQGPLNGGLFQHSFTDSTGFISGWIPLGGTFSFTSQATAVSRGGSDLEIFVRSPVGGMDVNTWNGSNWSSFAPLGASTAASTGDFMENPAVVWPTIGTMTVFGRGSDTGIYFRYFDASTSTWHLRVPIWNCKKIRFWPC